MLFYILAGLVLGARAITLSQLAQKFNTMEQKIIGIQNQLEHGGKKYQTLQFTTSKYIAMLQTLSFEYI